MNVLDRTCMGAWMHAPQPRARCSFSWPALIRGSPSPRCRSAEPARTERLISEVLGRKRGRAYANGYGFETLDTFVWLSDASGRNAWAVAYRFGQVILLLAIAIITGMFILAGSGGVSAQLSILIAFTTTGAAWEVCGLANDQLQSASLALCYLLECVALAIILWAGLVSRGAGGQCAMSDSDGTAPPRPEIETYNSTVAARAAPSAEECDLESLAFSLHLAEVAANLLLASIFAPLALSIYDAFTVPLITAIWRTHEGSPIEVFCEVFMGVLLLPVVVAETFLGFGGTAKPAVVDDFEDSIKDVAVGYSTRQLLDSDGM